MLGTLLKYELKAVGRIVLPFLAALIAASGLFALSLAIGGTDIGESGSFIQVLFLVLMIGLFFASGIVTLVLIVQRFYKNLLGDEGYLMFSIPTTTASHIASKTISAAIWSLAGTVAGLIAILIIFAGSGFLPDLAADLKELVQVILEATSSWNAILYVVEIILITLIGTLFGVTEIYAAIAIGHLWSEHRILGAIIAYIGINVVLQTLMTAVAMPIISGPLNTWLNDLTFTEFTPHLFLLGTLFLYGILTVVFSLVTWYVLDRNLNLQ